jgi:thioredoxin reductase (NADPH)
MAADTHLGELLLRTFILRRVELLANGHTNGIVVGSRNSVGTLRIREFLTRNGYPHAFLDLDRDKEVQSTMDAFSLTVEDIPVLILHGKEVLRNPSDAEIAAYLGLNASVDAEEIRDVAIVGAGPAGLSAAVYAASEGLSAIVLEAKAPGGQAGSSSKIENYLGFPTGISGLELASHAYTQSQKFGAELLIARSAVQLSCSGQPYELKTTEGTSIRCSAVVIATGAQYRKLPLPNLEAFEGVGVYYGATAIEAQSCGDENVIVVGGGNSAGQAAVYLSQSARHVHILIRRGNLADTMSRYLVQRIEQSPKITLHTYTEIVELRGDDHLESVVVRDSRAGTDTPWNIRHVYLMTGASPNTDWLRGCVALDDKGFVKTGPDLSPQELSDANWPLQRRPHLLETSLPGVFAVGDVRSGSVKRVASGVGEGSLSVHFIHLALAEG